MSVDSNVPSAKHYVVPHLEIAHVLFMDIVAFSQLPMEKQAAVAGELQEVVRNTAEFTRAEAQRELLCRPTGDGMALIFLHDMLAPLRCAVEIATALKSRHQILLRMGIHSGPVYIVTDINSIGDVQGDGIVMAQRVMDCGDAGHILLSSQAAEMFMKAAPWADYLHDIGPCKIKHGGQVQLVNLYTRDIGNRRVPVKVRDARRETRGEAVRQGPLGVVARLLRGLAWTTAVVGLSGLIVWYTWPFVRQRLMPPEAAPANALNGRKPPAANARHKPAKTADDPPPTHNSHAGTGKRLAANTGPEEAAPAPMAPRLLPGASPAGDPSSVGGETSSEEDIHSFDRTLSIPHDGSDLRQVRIEYQDARGWQPAVVDARYGEGDQIPIHFDYAGWHVTLRVYYDDRMAKEWKMDLSPPPEAGND